MIFPTFRKVSRFDHYTIRSGAHVGGNHMENKIAFRWNDRLCCELESYARATYRWHCPLPSRSRWCLRTTCPTRSLHHRRRPRECRHKSKKGPRRCFDRSESSSRSNMFVLMSLMDRCHKCNAVVPFLSFTSL